MPESVKRVLVVGGLQAADAAALRELMISVEVVCGASWLTLLREARETRPSLIYARQEHLKAALVGRAASVPVVVEAGASDDALTVARAARLSARAVCGSAAMRDLLIANGAAPARTGLLRGLLPADGPHRACDLPPNAPRWIVSAAPIDETDRGISDLVLAFLTVARSRPNVKLLLTGPGAGARVIDQAEAAGFRGRVAWLPVPPAQLPQMLASSTVFVGPARTPAYADAIPEAMAAGAAIVATAVGPHPAWLREGRTGFLVPPKAPVALAARLGQLLDDPALALRLGAEARKVALDASAPRSRAVELSRCFHAVVRPLSSMHVPILERKTA